MSAPAHPLPKPSEFPDNPYRKAWGRDHFLYTMDGPMHVRKHPCYRTYARSKPFVGRFRHAVDVGCRIGEYSRYLMMDFDRLTAFDARYFSAFRYNVELDRTTHYTCALGDQPGKIRMYGGTHDAAPDKKEHLVRCYRLDDFALEDVDYIKIDVEGFEKKVILGARETIERCNPLIVIEQNDVSVEGEDRFAARTLLEEWGYSQAAVDKRGWDFVMVRPRG